MIICPGCGADMHFSPKKQMLVCGYCDAEMSPDAYAEAEGLTASDEKYYDTTIFACPQCGGEVMNTEETAATFCSYCGASVMLESRMGKGLRPKKIIPFSIDQEQVRKQYKDRIRKAIFAPEYLRKDSEIERFRGIYMPYWSYSMTLDQDVKANGEKSERKGDYIITDEYLLTAEFTGTYEGIAFDSASVFEDSISESIAPFDVHKTVDFNPAYLSGFYADKGDVPSEVYESDARQYVKDEVCRTFMNEFSDLKVNADKVKSQVKPENTETAPVLYPVWFLTNRFGKNRVTYAVVNGESGKVAADIPISPAKYLAASVILMIPLYLLLNLFPAIEPPYMMITALVLHLICTVVSWIMKSMINAKDNKDFDKGYNSVNGQSKKKEKQASMNLLEYLPQILILLAGIAIFILSPVSDLTYYSCCSVILGVVALAFIGIIKDYNILTTHKPPQLEARGGDERA